MRALESAVHEHDVEAVIACFAPDIRIRSPITQRITFVGIEQAADLFRRLFSIISDIRIYETVGEDDASQVIFWRGRVGRHYIEEANLLRLDDAGRIREMTVFMRPVPGLLVLAAAIGHSLAGRRGRARGLVVGLLLGTIATLYRVAEPAVIALVGAGVPVAGAERRPVLRQKK